MKLHIYKPISYLALGMALVMSFSVSVFAQIPEVQEALPEVQQVLDDSGADDEEQDLENDKKKDKDEDEGEVGSGDTNFISIPKVWICHYPPGNLNNPQLLEIPFTTWLSSHFLQHADDILVSDYVEGYECPLKGEEPENTPPVITLVGSSTITIMVGDTFTDPGATASDSEDGDLTNDIVEGGTVDTGTPGTYVLTYDVEDSDGADATQVTRTVLVEEEETPTEYPYGTIIAPTTGQIVSGTTTLVAEYNDGDAVNDDGVQWAVRKGSCTGSENTVFGNVDGHTDSFAWDGSDFSSGLDFSGEDEGEYCFVFNPTDDGPVDVRETVMFTVEHDDPEEPGEHDNDAYLVAHKIVCEAEADLPDWGNGGSDIGSTTASDFVAASEGRCHFEEGWEFQWDPTDGVTFADDDFYGPAPTWTSFDGGATDENGMTHAWVDVAGGSFWVREVLKEGYIPFTWFWNPNNAGNPVSAEMYCGSDVLHYDNLDQLQNPVAGQTYYCVAFNALIDDGEEPQNTPPVITLNGSSTVTVIQGDSYADAGASVNDAEDDPEPALVVGGLPVNTSVIGTTTVTYDATDSGLLAANQVTRTVVVMSAEIVDENSDGDTEDEDDDERSRRRSGSRINRNSSSQGEVLGAFDDDGSSCGMYLLEYLQMGRPNNPVEVNKLQTFLNNQGYAVPVTGFFGPLTHAAVKSFQAAQHSKVIAPWIQYGFGDESTGYVYKTTRHTINEIMCPGSETYPTLP